MAILSLLTGCDLPTSDPKVITEPLVWPAGRPARFSYTFSRDCYCLDEWTGPFLVTVTAESVLTVRRISGKDTIPVTTEVQSYSIDSVFARINLSLKENPDSSYVKIDETYRYPVRAYFDFVRQMADDELGLNVTEFRSLTP